MTQDYNDRSQTYFSAARTELEPLLAAFAPDALDVGCGSGETVEWLKRAGRVRNAWGIEVSDSAAARAQEHFEHVLVGDAEKLIVEAFEGISFDLILCLDVLEHMVDPWEFVKVLQDRLTPGGKLIISVPNIRCVKVLLPLAFKGQWAYGEQGILDRTHLRFFARATALELAASTKLKVDRCLERHGESTRLEQLDRWTRGAFSDFTALQFVVVRRARPDRGAAASTMKPTLSPFPLDCMRSRAATSGYCLSASQGHWCERTAGSFLTFLVSDPTTCKSA